MSIALACRECIRFQMTRTLPLWSYVFVSSMSLIIMLDASDPILPLSNLSRFEKHINDYMEQVIKHARVSIE